MRNTGRYDARRFRLTAWTAAIIPVVLSLGGSAARAQRVAVVVGVGHYSDSHIPDLSPACPHDAQLMAEALRNSGYGFAVTQLTDGDATRQKILDAIRAQRGQATQFVFFFSGHGSQGEGGEPFIVPDDFTAEGENALTVDDLYQEVKAVGAAASTIILDSCFSGAMMKGRPLLGGLRAKYYAWSGVRQMKVAGRPLLGERMANHLDGNQILPGATGGAPSKICYFVASSGSEYSWCDNSGSVFTRHLAAHLDGSHAAWGRLDELVATEVADELRRFPGAPTQTPQLSPGFYNRTYFDNADSDYVATDLASVFTITNVDPAVLSLMQAVNGGAQENVTTVKPQDEIVYRVTTARPGYLVVLNRDAGGNTQVLFPKSGSAQEGYRTSGQTQRLPTTEGHCYYADQKGVETVKAILFPTAQAAQEVLTKFGNGAVPARAMQDKALREAVMRSSSDFFTAEIRVESQP